MVFTCALCACTQAKVRFLDISIQTTRTSNRSLTEFVEENFPLIIHPDAVICKSCLKKTNELDEALVLVRDLKDALMSKILTAPVHPSSKMKEEIQECQMMIETNDEDIVNTVIIDESHLSDAEIMVEMVESVNVQEQDEGRVCELCAVLCEDEYDYERHKANDHPEEQQRMEEKPLLISCDICGLKLPDKESVRVHSTVEHNGKETFYACPICNKNFSTVRALQRHKLSHTREAKYQCDKCGKDFIHHSSFRIHLLTHDNVRMGICKVCGLKFRTVSHLNRHMKIHTGEKPFACPTCDQRFAQRYNMMVHFRNNHGEKAAKEKAKGKLTYKCTLCPIQFQRKAKLQEHMLDDHHIVKDEDDGISPFVGGAPQGKYEEIQIE